MDESDDGYRRISYGVHGRACARQTRNRVCNTFRKKPVDNGKGVVRLEFATVGCSVFAFVQFVQRALFTRNAKDPKLQVNWKMSLVSEAPLSMHLGHHDRTRAEDAGSASFWKQNKKITRVGSRPRFQPISKTIAIFKTLGESYVSGSRFVRGRSKRPVLLRVAGGKNYFTAS